MMIDPVLAAMAATVVGLGGVAVPVPAGTLYCAHRSSSSALSPEELREIVAELTAAARRDPTDPQLGDLIREKVLAALPAHGAAGVVPIAPATAGGLLGSPVEPPDGEDPGPDGWLTPVPLGGAPAEGASEPEPPEPATAPAGGSGGAAATGDEADSGTGATSGTGRTDGTGAGQSGTATGRPSRDGTAGRDGTARGGATGTDDAQSGGAAGGGTQPDKTGSTPRTGGADGPNRTRPDTTQTPSPTGTCSDSPEAAAAGLDLAASITDLTGRILESVMGFTAPLWPAGNDDDRDADRPAGGGTRGSSDERGADAQSRDSDEDTGSDQDASSDRDADSEQDADSDQDAGGSRPGGTASPRPRNGGTAGSDGSTDSRSTGSTGSTGTDSTSTRTGSATSATGPAAALDRAIRDLARALRASTDPAMQQLGEELLAILAEGPVVTAPLPGTGNTATGTGTGTATDVLPATVTALFHDDFESGHLGKWGTCQGAGINGDCAEATVSDGMGVAEDPERGLVAQFSVIDGEEAEMGGERSEVRDGNNPGTLVEEGDDRWYTWSMKFPADFPDPDGGWNIVMQWHQKSNSGSPPLALDISRGSLDIGGDGVDAPRETIGPIRRGEWVDYVLHVGFSTGDGFVEAWENGVQTVPRTARPTMTDEANYLKMGIYRDPNAAGDAEVLFDDFTIHGA
ncbi:MAG: heparin lyase I family protein [Pseudonocardia sp.]